MASSSPSAVFLWRPRRPLVAVHMDLSLPLVPDLEASPHSRVSLGNGVYGSNCGSSLSVEWHADSSNLPTNLPPVTLGGRIFGVDSQIPKANQNFLKAYSWAYWHLRNCVWCRSLAHGLRELRLRCHKLAEPALDFDGERDANTTVSFNTIHREHHHYCTTDTTRYQSSLYGTA